MGCKNYLTLIKHVLMNNTCDKLPNQYDLLLIDGNCLIHSVMEVFGKDYDIHDINVFYDRMYRYFYDFIYIKHKPSYNYKVIITFDGVPPKPKQLTQKLRRIKSTNVSTLLIPGTKIMHKIENFITSKFSSDYVLIDSSQVAGEGEQKLMKYLKEYDKTQKNKHILFCSLDSDVLILTKIFYYNLSTTDKITPRNNVTVHLYSQFNYHFILNINKFIDKYHIFKNYLLFMTICFGNDFFPELSEIKKYTKIKFLEDFILSNIKSCTAVTTVTNVSTAYNNDVAFKNNNDVTFNNFSIDFKAEIRKFEIFKDQPSKCSSACNQKTIYKYLSTINWYYNYFLTNSTISCDGYDETSTPCVNCLLNYANTEKLERFVINHDYNKSTKDHLEYVLTDVLKKLDYGEPNDNFFEDKI